MTTATSHSAAGQKKVSQYAQKKLTFTGTVLSEFLKYRSLTTNWVMILITLVVMVGLAALAAWSINFSLDNPSNFSFDIDTLKNSSAALGGGGIQMANMLIASLGVVFIGSEYSTRSMQSTLTAVPKRSMVYWAKFLVITLVTFVLGYVSAALSFFLGQLILKDEIRMSVNSGILLNWLAIAAYFVFMGWLGLGLGALLRNNAGAIVSAVVIIFVSYFIFLTLPWQWAVDFKEYLPIAVGDTFVKYGLDDDAKIGYDEAGLALAAWGAVPALLGYIRFKFTDSK